MYKALIVKIFEGFFIQRWTDLIRPFEIVEMDKAAERMYIAYIIGKMEEARGAFVDWQWMIYASLFDLMKKLFLCDIKSPLQNLIRAKYSEEWAHLSSWIIDNYKLIVGDEDLLGKFEQYMKTPSEKAEKALLPTMRIFRAANKMASLRELEMLSIVNEKERSEHIHTQLLSELQEFTDLAGLSAILIKQRTRDFLLKVEQLRFQIRWNQTPRIPKSSVLGHCYFVAVVTLLLSRQNPAMCAERAVNNFFGALFHDLPEAVTRDIISPVKQATDEFPSIIKKIEDETVSAELLPLMDSSYKNELLYFMTSEFENRVRIDGKTLFVDSVELDEKYNEAVFHPVDGKIVRAADHLAAFLEAGFSIKYGVASPHLQAGLEELLSHYPENIFINGLAIGRLFRDLLEYL